jgi:hypothetical protein
MGAHSTIDITRTKARRTLVMAIMEADDTMLEDMMDNYLYEKLYNCNIVEDDHFPNDDWCI